MIQQCLELSREARDAGMVKVKAKNPGWTDRALVKLPAMKLDGHSTTTGEGMRNWLLEHGLEEPTSPYAWGMLTRLAMKRGMIRDTGRSAQMTDVKSHARRTPLWELV